MEERKDSEACQELRFGFKGGEHGSPKETGKTESSEEFDSRRKGEQGGASQYLTNREKERNLKKKIACQGEEKVSSIIPGVVASETAV